LCFEGLVIKECGAHQAGTTENLVVCQGSLVVTVGDREYRLVAGDALYFEADVPHRYRNPQPESAQAFLVMSYGDAG
jgi:quercetin dioxygenase-like cupin family protein